MAQYAFGAGVMYGRSLESNFPTPSRFGGMQDVSFDFSFTTKERGTGVGLAIVRQAAEIHGGVVRLESQVGHGTSIVIRLPVRSASSQNSRS